MRSAEPAGCSRKHERGACRCCCCFAVPKPPAACWPPADCCHQSSSLTNCSTAPHPRPTGHLGGAAGDCACCGRHGHQDARGGGHVTNCTWGPNEIDSQTLAVAAPLSCEMGRMRLQPQLPNPPPALLPEYQFFHCSRPFSCIATAPLRHCKSPALQPRQTAASRAKPHPAAAPQLWTAALFNSGRLPSRSLPPARCRASSYMGRGPPLPKGCECTAATGCLQGPHALSAYFRSGKARAFLAAFSVLALAWQGGKGARGQWHWMRVGAFLTAPHTAGCPPAFWRACAAGGGGSHRTAQVREGSASAACSRTKHTTRWHATASSGTVRTCALVRRRRMARVFLERRSRGTYF